MLLDDTHRGADALFPKPADQGDRPGIGLDLTAVDRRLHQFVLAVAETAHGVGGREIPQRPFGERDVP